MARSHSPSPRISEVIVSNVRRSMIGSPAAVREMQQAEMLFSCESKPVQRGVITSRAVLCNPNKKQLSTSSEVTDSM